tara:strand:- start:2 stop:268 length:267 start_codon:yes stop_codon:yes gene_type:complete
MKKIDLSIPLALGFSIPGAIVLIIFLHYFTTNTPVFNLPIDVAVVLILSIFWIYIVRWIDSRDINGNPIYYYDSIHNWKKWYYSSKKR